MDNNRLRCLAVRVGNDIVWEGASYKEIYDKNIVPDLYTESDFVAIVNSVKTEGFVTESGIFVSKEEGYRIAVAAGQLNDVKPDGGWYDA